MVHIGSWGLPDFGATEFVSDLLNIPRDPTTGGSQNYGSYAPIPEYEKNITEAKILADKRTSSPPPSNNIATTPTNNNVYNFNQNDFQNYAGWDPAAALADWKSKGEPLPSGGSGGSGGSSDPYAAVRNDINSGYNAYFNSLDAIMNQDLPNQVQNQNQMINNLYGSSIADLDSQRNIGMNELGGQRTEVQKGQKKSLTDLAENIRNMFMTGSVMLGSRGAGDSSASNQYSYALTKLGNKARGEVMNQSATSLDQIRQREFRLGETYRAEKTRLETEKTNQILGVANWFSEQQSQIRQMKASGQLSQSTDLANLSRSILDQALNQLNMAQQQIANRNNMLEQWAISQSKSLSQLKSNMAGISGYQAQLPQTPSIGGTPTFSGNNFTMKPTYFGSPFSDEEKSIYG